MRTFMKMLVLAAAALVGAGHARAEVVVSNHGLMDGSMGVISFERPWATSFRTGSGFDWRMESVKIVMNRYGSDNYERVTLSIHADANGQPGDALYVSPQQNPAPQPSVKEIQITATVELASNTTYWLVLRRSAGQIIMIHGTASEDEESSHGWTLGNATYVATADGGWIRTNLIAAIEVSAARIPKPPIIKEVRGCFDAGQVTLNCPPEGGAIIRVSGDYFTTRTRVLIGGFPPAAQEFISPTEIRCTLAPGALTNLPVTVVDTEGMALLANAVSYEERRCYGDSDFDGVVGFHDLTETLANWNATCP